MTQQVRAQRPSHPAALALPRMTYEEFLEWDFENPHVEWVDGEVVMMAPVSYEHQDVRGFLFALLKHFIEEHDLGRLLDDPFQMKTGPALPGRAPDVQFISNKNFGRLKKNHLKGPADLVIEIISPGSRGTDRGDKFYEYEKGGVKEYWLIDPERRRAEFYRLGRDKQFHLMPIDKDGVVRSEVLKGLWLKVDWLWQRPLPKLKKVLKEWGLV
ncbi:MAG TPA: Uma2 family endonuclease [Tepidisphaeraceae bacterium]|nr:Uma2 family endonuclease [Tepidisphaeraceae bacterium]